MKRVVWIISEGSPGHVSQSEGLVRALSRQIGLEVVRVETRPRFGGLVRKGVMLWMGRAGRPLPGFFLSRFLECAPPEGKPDLIVTSGGKAVFAARTLSLRCNTPLVFIGERKPYPSAWFHTVLTPSPFETDENDVALERIPTSVTAESLAAAAQAWKDKPEGPLWTMIVGGSSASHPFAKADWQRLGDEMNGLSKTHGIRWLVTTSRRTGPDAESILRASLDPAHVADAVWWSEVPRRVLHAFVGAAERVFVTQDSVTMVTEAMAAGTPPVVLSPADVRFPGKSFLPGYFSNLEAHGWIVRKPIAGLADADLSPPRAPGAMNDATERMASAVISRLGFDPA